MPIKVHRGDRRMNDLIFLGAALLAAMAAVLLYVVGAELKRNDLIEWGKVSTHLTFIFITIASLRLFYLLITHDFQNMYVATYTSRDLPLFYVVSAFWAGQQGSFLLWVWLIAIFASALLFIKKDDERFMAYTLAMLAAIMVGFLYILVTVSNPFERLDFIPADGNGLNPLLQDPGMVLHPPVLFIGYAGLAVPFAFAVAGVIMKRDWIKSARSWLILAWVALSMGNIIGAWWAYHVLGWGGYWAWDPVENSSLLPWLTASALLHTMMIEEKTGKMRLSNFLLITITFILVLYGTFLTRSGILESVHAFANSGLGGILMGFLLIILTASVRLMIRRRDYLKSDPVEFDLSRSGLILITSILLVISTGTVLAGSFYPLILEFTGGVQQMVQAGYYNKMNVPIAVMILLLLGVCPLIGWRRYTMVELKKNVMVSAISAVTVLVIALIGGIRNLIALSGIIACTFALTTHIFEFYTTKKSGNNILDAIGKNHRRFGGYIVHISLIVMVIGVCGSSIYDERDIFTLQIGSEHTIGDYTMRYGGTEMIPSKSGVYYVAIVDLYRDGRVIGRAMPDVYYSYRFDQTYQHVYIKSTLLEDFYLVYQGSEQGYALFEVRILPLVSFIWWGGILLLLGGIVALMPDKRRNEK